MRRALISSALLVLWSQPVALDIAAFPAWKARIREELPTRRAGKLDEAQPDGSSVLRCPRTEGQWDICTAAEERRLRDAENERTETAQARLAREARRRLEAERAAEEARRQIASEAANEGRDSDYFDDFERLKRCRGDCFFPGERGYTRAAPRSFDLPRE